jgi:hypothetical protein
VLTRDRPPRDQARPDDPAVHWHDLADLYR